MAARFKALALNPTRNNLWVHTWDTGMVVPRRIAVQVPWPMLADSYQALQDGMNHEFARRLQAEAEAAQWTLPGID